MAYSNTSADRRKARVRRAVLAHSGGRPRLSVFRSSKQIYAQVIDDERGHTVAAASSLEKTLRESMKTGATVDAMPRVANGLGVSIVSTPKGVMADHSARENNVGGEVLCTVF